MKAVVVTTKHKGVFFGYVLDGVDYTRSTITLTDARMCVYWIPATRGFLGLAFIGPQPGCRISPAVSEITLRGVTSVTCATEKAVLAWEAEPWA